MEHLQKAAKIAFASQFSFYLKAHFCHWNVEGIYFQELHSLFGTIYGEVYDSIDAFAEKIRTLDTYAPGSNSRFSVLSAISDETEVIPAEQMIRELLADSDHMVVILKKVYDIAEAEGEHGFSNFLAERMDAFRKHSWMLRASLK
ncbi:MAG TPA: DNA starvation/stationary phase protection protein [Methanosarcina sp.]|nr:DNA starvation/stationary phase protection protein [Methanosarcina sp.]